MIQVGMSTKKQEATSIKKEIIMFLVLALAHSSRTLGPDASTRYLNPHAHVRQSKMGSGCCARQIRS